jgi:hypothetical protein
LHHVPELGAEDDGTARLVVLEQEMKLSPHVLGGACWRHHHVMQLLGNDTIHSEDDGEVVVAPHNALMGGIGGGGEVMLDIVFATNEVE